jgi:hypothetical protein
VIGIRRRTGGTDSCRFRLFLFLIHAKRIKITRLATAEKVAVAHDLAERRLDLS